MTPEVTLNERKSNKCGCLASFTFDGLTGDLIFNDDHKVECKQLKLTEIVNNPYHFKLTVSPTKQNNLQKMAEKQIKSDWATGNRSLQKSLNGKITKYGNEINVYY